ncbi:GNAT superfamily N-acetyltransferase [Actinoplanes octamycinicus]|uniref:GNAT superfamily N-acetyltransferase n=1 Tax=Actinoplanes octamycinicus TaxID=135948 RepID=A0A7W7MA58_9ACTN|nr:GNAT family N-acetyltransferase [Actinoplanes octamycinicus]MBB4742637.1 GNAT superfamily N-acetyltransferase [Actinoplanes octamycinicus]GIE60975.1 hypothetical protein Aoc01nite_63770 [Actinoplanes octamycinicus]
MKPTGRSTPAITAATPADLPRILRIRHAAFTRHAPTAYPAEQVETLLRDVSPDELSAMISAGTLFVARAAGQVLGCAGWRDDRLRHVYVDPDATRRGIGTALLRHVETDFRARTGRSELAAGVALHAEAFYLANGYRLVDRARAWDGSTYLRMLKSLS